MGINTGPAEAKVDGDRATGYTGYSTLARVARVMAAGHGGQMLLSDTAAGQVRDELPDGVDLRNLGQHRLKGLLEPTHLWQVVVADLPQSFPRLRTASSVASNLPASLTRFVGRKRELQQVKDLVAEHRLVTLVGPGGTGKTRLALQAATDLREPFGDRVYLVDLAGSSDEGAVLPLVARAIGLLDETPGRSLLDDLREHIGDQATLLFLDNFERVIAAAPALAELLRDCPGLKQLVTSREALHVSGERVFSVPPMTVPGPADRDLSLIELGEADAIELFVERARAVDPEFRLTADNARLVTDLCVGLDGLPLAIELATARLGFLTPEALVDRLGRRLELLRGGPRDAPARQQTLRGTIDWSYEMLDEGEQRLFALLSVFTGATVEAVEGVMGRVEGVADTDVFDALGSLVDKSLLRLVDRGEVTSRLVMLETIREYAGERLDEDRAFADAVRRAHASHFADWTEAQWEELTGSEQEVASGQMAADIDNIRTAWRYWVDEKDFEQLSKLTDSMWLLYDARGWYHATAALTTDLLEVLSSTPSSPERAVAELTLQTSLARVLMVVKGDTAEVEAAWRRALELSEGQPESPQLLPVLRSLASFYMLRAEFARGAELAGQILDLADRHDDADARTDGHLVLGANLAFLGQLRSGMEHLEAGIAAHGSHKPGSRRFRLGNNPGVVCFTTSAMVLWMLGFPDRARDRIQQAMDLAEDLDHPSSIAYAHFHAGLIHLWRREPAQVEARTQTVLQLADEYDFQIWTAVGSCLRGAALAEMGSAEDGLALVEAAMNNYQRLPSPPVFWPLLLHIQAGVCGAAGRPADGLALEAEAIEIATEGEGQMFGSEFFHRYGELVLAATPDEHDEAEVWFRRAVETGAALDAPMFQLRAALPLARLWHEQGKVEDAHRLVSEAYGAIDEGFDTADLIDAKALLDELAP